MKTKTKNEIKAFIKPYKETIAQLIQIFRPELWAFKEVMGTWYSSQKQIYFQEFLEGIAYDFANASLNQQDVRLLMKKVSNSGNYKTMADILDSVFFSHGKISRTILGIITGKFMRDDNLDYEDMVIISALKDLFDEDLNRFWQYCSYLPMREDDPISFIEQYSETDKIIVEKLQNVGILGRDLATRLSGKSLRFELTIISKRLQNYMRTVQSVFENAVNN